MLLRSPWGKAFTALRDNPIRAESLGVNITAYTLLAFAIGAACACSQCERNSWTRWRPRTRRYRSRRRLRMRFCLKKVISLPHSKNWQRFRFG